MQSVYLRLALRVSSPRRRAPSATARPPCLPDSFPAPTTRKRVRRNVHASHGARNRQRGLPADRLFPEQRGALANNLVQASFGLRKDAVQISVWSQLAPVAGEYLGIQTVEFLIGDQLRVTRHRRRRSPNK